MSEIYYNTDNYSSVVNQKIYKKNEMEYLILNYNNELMTDNVEDTKYRSVIKDKEDKLLCYSLPKSIEYKDFQDKYDIKEDDVIVTEIIEGTMINIFYNKKDEKWEMATKSALGGKYFFYRNEYNNTENTQKDFKTMLLESIRSGSDTKVDINDVPLINSLPSKSFCYSFVLQHPDNHIVLELNEPKLYLITAFEIFENKARQVTMKELKMMNVMPGIVYYPKEIEKEESYEMMNIKYTMDKCKLNMGLMYLNERTGDRCHNRHETYEKMRLLRGNNPNLQYQYLCLKKMGKVKEFLNFFPKYKTMFYRFYNEYKNFLMNLHKGYLSYYIQKTGEKIEKKYFYHLYRIHHNIYLPSVNSKNKKIMNKSEIYNYFENYDPIQQLYFLNYQEK